MKWRLLERSTNVEDRSAQAVAVGGGIGLLAFIVALIAFLIPGGDDPSLDNLQAPTHDSIGPPNLPTTS